ncbi:MAG: N-(5'-phosphoribosyl)anthranilate isomerase [Alphaproteobacteria bacterium MarineAlpha6_Bin5]|nr:MAG: N-(5'-phosphoribosyl)anthranilate isomerase [Alphaproteobacteria bacterium MarineAlpha6_Bin5]|tara:strand:+ start:4353 stop:4997 length:645 start_codon:yes stop_codon:yes gene_type:complete
MALKVKICGVKSISHVKACINGKANMIGLMFYNKSPRYLNLELAKKISNFAKKKIKKVGVFANADINKLKKITESVQLDYLQFHGNESVIFLKKVKKMFKIKIIRAIKISNKSDLNKISIFNKVSDYILLDTKIVKKKNLNYKKKSRKLNWDLINKIKNKKKLILSGGLSVDNLELATKKSNIKFVDASSGLETLTGKKNIKKINKFLELAGRL